MSDTAIKVEGLGKQYIIGHKKQGDLRHALGDKIKGIFKPDASEKEIFWALKDINFEIKHGEAVGIIGRNGAGKSTLLKILSRITEPSSGRFEINGRVSSLLEVGTGFHMELTGRENIFLNGTILGMKRAEIKQKFDEIVDFSGVEKFLDTPVKHYSSGMKVRLAFSVAAHLEPEILIVDEVLAVGDAEFQKKCLGKMDQVSKNEGRTVVFVSHNMGAVQTLCNTGILLSGGKIKVYESASEAISFYLRPKNEYSANITTILNDLVKIEYFKISKNSVTYNEIFTIEFKISSKVHNSITDLALLFYNDINERVAIIDFRNNRINLVSENNKEIITRVRIDGCRFMEGNYSVGLFLSSMAFHGESLDLGQFTVQSERKHVARYEQQYRGYVEMKYDVIYDDK